MEDVLIICEICNQSYSHIIFDHHQLNCNKLENKIIESDPYVLNDIQKNVLNYCKKRLKFIIKQFMKMS